VRIWIFSQDIGTELDTGIAKRGDLLNGLPVFPIPDDGWSCPAIRVFLGSVLPIRLMFLLLGAIRDKLTHAGVELKAPQFSGVTIETSLVPAIQIEPPVRRRTETSLTDYSMEDNP
jgi:hypothetical protein